MGTVVSEVTDSHLKHFPEEEQILKPFLDGFDITWGRRRTAYNTELSVYFLKPESFITETYGFEREILLVYSPYSPIESRALQAADSFLTDSPAKGRVEQLNYFLISEDPNVKNWIKSYVLDNQETRIIIAFSTDELKESKGDSWFVRNNINQQLYGRDLFDYRLPLQRDTYFFGREDILMNLRDSIRQGENRGLFGLRKTGKTSILYKLERMLNLDGGIKFFYYDCKSPSIRKLRWNELLNRISTDIYEKCEINHIAHSFNEADASKSFEKTIEKCGKSQRLTLVFDEIEYITPFAKLDQHWHNDYLDLWQTFWSAQSRYRNLSIIIAGVNPSIVEVDNLDSIQNPLFGIVSYQYLKGLSNDDINKMLKSLGKRMGIQFEQNAIDYMFKHYGGHPLLTRIACSLINAELNNKKINRPFKVTTQYLEVEKEKRDSDLVFYCRHVVSELNQFYPDEYEMLELLSSGQIKSYLELAAYPDFTKHLEAYGLLSNQRNGIPHIIPPVIDRYIGLELARREGRSTILKIINKVDRPTWLQNRLQSILKDFRFLEKLISKGEGLSLFGPNSFPEADNFISLHTCDDKGAFENFINTCNRCFVESIEQFGLSIQYNQYYWKEIKNAYPGLWDSLQRIKLYRHDNLHLVLREKANQELLEYFRKDLEGRNPSQVEDLYFVLQQCVLDGLLTGLQVEIQKLT